MGNFQQDIRKTLIKYALAPIFVLAVLLAVFAWWSWQHDVVQRSEEAGSVAAEVLDRLLLDYGQRIEYVANNGDFANIQDNAEHRRALYEWLYHEVNIAHDDTRFFLVDRDGRILLSNHTELPVYLQSMPMSWGIWQRMAAGRDRIIAEFSPRTSHRNSDLLLGRAALRDGEIEGYWLFVISGNYLANAISSPYMDFAMTNSFGYAQVATSPDLQAGEFQALPEAFAGKNRQTADFNRRDFYVTSQRIGESDFYLYSAMPVSDLKARYEMAAAVLLGMLSIMLPVLLYLARQESKARAKAVEELNTIFEMRQLEAQFHPHFIFNTLENIKFMIRLNPAAAVKMVVNLSSILRYGINNLVQEVTLAEEWKYTRAYLEIMQYRFGKRLHCEFDLQVDMDRVKIPKLIFQPILENAIKYGEAEDGSISVRLGVYEMEGELIISVANGGAPIPPEQMKALQLLLQGRDNPTVHTGIYNVHRRLRLMYGEKYGVAVHSGEQGGTLVELKLPLSMRQRPAEREGDDMRC
ncbi:histidine kinase [Anaerovibrio sp.]|uniref:sensor histidine kinase n=1 Tax=Anaerovibrio sp. TaxID=1872532 RepID=UPI003F154772